MTRKAFWQDPYLTRLDTMIATASAGIVTLSETIFYAFSGGQESDTGTIAGFEVLDARKDGSEIYYTLPASHGLRPGDPVTVDIDWERRYRLMRLHFAAEIVLELIYAKLPGVGKTGAHISADMARIDFQWPESIAGILPEIQVSAQAVIDADKEIISAFSDPETERRFWQVDGFARVPCGGTHLKRTGETGTIGLRRKNPGKGRERVEIILRE